MAKPVREKEADTTGTAGTRTGQPEMITTPAQPENRFNKGSLQVVEFLLGKERYAVDLYDIREVVEYTTITKLPNTPSYMKGIIDLRGEITTIVDLKDRLHIQQETEVDEETSRIIVLDEKITKARAASWSMTSCRYPPSTGATSIPHPQRTWKMMERSSGSSKRRSG